MLLTYVNNECIFTDKGIQRKGDNTHAAAMQAPRICRMPKACRFGPLGTDGGEDIALTLDEYETLRLIDLLGYTQEECAAQMGGRPHDGAGGLHRSAAQGG